MEYDQIVVGAGSAGAIVAGRLSEDATRSVLLLEAGPDYPDPDDVPEEIKYGLGRSQDIWAKAFGPDSEHNWGFVARATNKADPMRVPRGKIVGGSSAINAMVWLRGIPEDYDMWAAQGNDGWTYEELLPYFLKIEDDTESRGTFHGPDGPIKIRQYHRHEWNPDQEAFHDACRAAGYRDCPDHNDPRSTGVGPVDFNHFDDIRWSTCVGYLDSARHRPNLTIRPGCLVHQVLVEGSHATGVLVETGGEVSAVRGREIIVCAGAVGSPHILLLSGIGPAENLDVVGIKRVINLPGVGRNLRDHPQVSVVWKTRVDFMQDPLSPKAQLILRYTASDSKLRNDMAVFQGSVSDEGGSAIGTHEPFGVSMTSCVYLAEGSGELALQSSDPAVQPTLDYNFLGYETDRRRLREAVRLTVSLANHEHFMKLLEKRVQPTDEELSSDSTLDDWLMRTVTTSHHVSGTCKMGPASDPMAVVDQFGMVHGIDGLRVADASIMPDCIRANTNATAMVIGERIADFIRGGY